MPSSNHTCTALHACHHNDIVTQRNFTTPQQTIHSKQDGRISPDNQDTCHHPFKTDENSTAINYREDQGVVTLNLRKEYLNTVIYNTLVALWIKTEQFDIQNVILCQHIQELQTSKSGPVFWPTLYICTV